MSTDIHYRNAAELFDLRFLHAGPNSAVCCECGQIIELGEPELFGSRFAISHRRLCGAGPAEIV